jgi:hypothetical protein
MEDILPDLSITGFTTPEEVQPVDTALLPDELSVLASTQGMCANDAIKHFRSIMFEGSNIDELAKLLANYSSAHA